MIAKLIFEKFLDRGDKKMRLISFVGIYEYAVLPEEYLRRIKHFYRGNNSGASLDTIFFSGFKHPITDNPITDISQGEAISANIATDLISFVKECGKDLAKIKRRQKKENENWIGITEIAI